MSRDEIISLISHLIALVSPEGGERAGRLQPRRRMLQPLKVPSSVPQRRPTPNASKPAAGPCQAKDPNAFQAKPDPSAQAKDAAKARLIASSRGRAAAKQFGDRANPRSEAAIRERVRAEMRAEQAASKERALKEWQVEEEQHGQTLSLAAPGSAPAPPQGAPGISGLVNTSKRQRPGHWAPSYCLGCSSQPPPTSPIPRVCDRTGGQASEAGGAGSAAAGGGSLAAPSGAAGD